MLWKNAIYKVASLPRNKWSSENDTHRPFFENISTDILLDIYIALIVII